MDFYVVEMFIFSCYTYIVCAKFCLSYSETRDIFMPRSQRQKEKILHIYRILMEETDEEHGITVAEIIDRLSSLGISAERKSVYDDINTLESFGCDICRNKSNTMTYYIGSRTFELAELKLLVDSVQSSKFITLKKSQELISKVESLGSVHEGRQLHRQVYVANRVKNPNETIYYAVDRIHEAISKDRTITFYYLEWMIGGAKCKIEKRRRRKSKRYCVSPWALTWDDENYYLVAYDSESESIRHYRVDKMESVEITSDQRDGKDIFEKFDMALYSRSVFGMFGGDVTSVKLRFHNSMIGVVVDRFGKDLFISLDGDEHFIVNVSVALSRQFFGWLFGLSDKVEILSPDSAVQMFSDELLKVQARYLK